MFNTMKVYKILTNTNTVKLIYNGPSIKRNILNLLITENINSPNANNVCNFYLFMTENSL